MEKIKSNVKYKNIKFKISENENRIESITLYIKNCISYFDKNGIKNYNDEIAEIWVLTDDRKSINQFNKIVENLNIEIKKLQEDINNLDEKLSSIQLSEETLTVFILIKYGISYTEFIDYMKSKQSISTLVQQN